jgi:3D (Asp-Asp-Asp) domain-containing protein
VAVSFAVQTGRLLGATLLLAVATTACGAPAAEPAPDAAPAVAPPVERPAAGASRGEFQLTYYYITAEEDFAGAADTAIYDVSGAIIDRVPAKFATSLELEGTGRLSDGRVVNSAAGACSGKRTACYRVVDAQHPWGDGVQDRALVPFRTIAVDRNVIPYGTRLYIPELDGVVVPGEAPWGGFVHDGCVIAGDAGGRIIGAHIDLFSAVKASYHALDATLARGTITLRDGGARCAG